MNFPPRSVMRDGSGSRADCMIGDFCVSLYSELRQVLDDFVALYQRRSNDHALDDRTIRLGVRRAGRSRLGRRLYRVIADGQEVGGLCFNYGVFPLVEWGINLRIMATRREFVQCHAASMSHDGSGYIFAGDSGSGKSTLAATLLANGWQYLCDEFALIDRDSLRLYPFPKALCIKSGSYEVIRKLGLPFARRRDYVKAFKGRVGYINPRPFGTGAEVSPAPVRYVVLTSYRSGAQTDLMPIGRAEAATELYRCCFNKSSLPECGLPTIARLVHQAECYRLVIGDSAKAISLLTSLPKQTLTTSPRAPLQRVIESSVARRGIDRIASRREALKLGAKLAYVAPVVLTLTSRQAFAAASNPSGICSTATHTGQLCETDLDCCSRQCDLGVCR